MTGGMGEAQDGTYFSSQRRKHYLVCSCGWKKEILYGFGTNITYEEFIKEAEKHKEVCEVFKDKNIMQKKEVEEKDLFLI